MVVIRVFCRVCTHKVIKKFNGKTKRVSNDGHGKQHTEKLPKYTILDPEIAQKGTSNGGIPKIPSMPPKSLIDRKPPQICFKPIDTVASNHNRKKFGDWNEIDPMKKYNNTK